MVKRTVCIVMFSILTFVLLSANVFAEEQMECADEYKEMLDSLPSDVAELLPDKLFSDSLTDLSDGAGEVMSFSYILNIFAEYIGLKAKSVLKLFASILGILILSSLINSYKSSFSSEGVSSFFSMMSTGALILTAFASEYEVISSVSAFFSRLTVFANSLLPLSAALYAMGGNVAGAVVHHSSLMIFLEIVEGFCTNSAMPIASICMSLASVSAIAPEINLGSLTSLFKKGYTQILGLLMTAFVAVMGGQSLLAGKTDTLSGKALKLAVGNLIPTVGGALSGSLGTVAASVEYIRATVGIVGIAVVIIMIAPTLVTLVLTKLSFGILSGAAELLGCDAEKKIISELASINGFLLSLAAITSVCLIFIITIFVKCSSAVGGGAI